MTIFDYPKTEQLGSVSRTLGRRGVDSNDGELVDALVRKATTATVEAFVELAEDV